jgi:cyanophycinase-like exopeptidase
MNRISLSEGHPPMSSPTLRAALGAVTLSLLAACSGAGDLVSPADARLAKKVDPGYDIYLTGKGPDVSSVGHNRAVYLAGGGTDDDAGMAWLLAQGGIVSTDKKGKPIYGDVVILRTSGSKGYNNFVDKLGASTATTFVINSVDGANSPVVADAISKAEVIFLAGGDQSTYVNLWAGTLLQSAVNARLAQNYPIGGTSAGLNSLSQHIYSAQFASTTSAMALANPYDASITFANDLFEVPLLANVLAEPHFVTRDRMGRFYTFLARLQADGRASAPRGLAVDEGSGVGVSVDGSATVFGAGNGAYLVTTASTGASTLSAPLSYGVMSVVRVPVGGAFNMLSFTAAPSYAPYTISAAQGSLLSSKGTLY